jgi:hypothetical protein
MMWRYTDQTFVERKCLKTGTTEYYQAWATYCPLKQNYRWGDAVCDVKSTALLYKKDIPTRQLLGLPFLDPSLALMHAKTLQAALPLWVSRKRGCLFLLGSRQGGRGGSYLSSLAPHSTY